MFSSIVFTLAEIVQPVAPRQTCLAYLDRDCYAIVCADNNLV